MYFPEWRDGVTQKMKTVHHHKRSDVQFRKMATIQAPKQGSKREHSHGPSVNPRAHRYQYSAERTRNTDEDPTPCLDAAKAVRCQLRSLEGLKWFEC
jgi:hypothetical protein